MPRTIKLIGLSLAGVFALILLCIVFLATFDWNSARPWINQRVSDATGRRFAIQGDLRVTWLQPDALRQSWANWRLWPRVQADNIVFGNPEWAPYNSSMAEVERLALTVKLWPLLRRKIVIDSLEATNPRLILWRKENDVNNWTFKSAGGSAWDVELHRIAIRQGVVELNDARQQIDAKADIDTLESDTDQPYGIGWNVSGTYNHAKIRGGGKAGGVLSLQDVHRPYPLQGEIRVGRTRIAVKGTLTKPSALAALDLQLTLSGDSMAHLYPLTGIVLPETPPFSTTGRLIGKLDLGQSNWIYEKFSGKVGASDLAGTLEYQSKLPRPLLKGEVTSKLLRFEDLAPLIGADSNARKKQRGAQERQPAKKVLPVKQFQTDRWGSIDADVKFTGIKVLREKNLPINNLQANLHLEDKVLTLAPLNFGMAGGSLTSTVRLDGREPLMKSTLTLSARRIEIQQLFPDIDASRTSFGKINGDAALTASGNSVAALLGSSSGELKISINHGAISKLLLEEMGLNIGNIIVSKLFGDRQVKLNCMIGDLVMTDGVMQTRTVKLDTEEAMIDVSGRINLAQEQLALTINPKSKGVRIVSLRTPLFVTGPFIKPDIGFDKSVLGLKAGGAVLLGVVAPVAAILPLINMSDEQNADCAALLQELQKTPAAAKKARSLKTQPAHHE